MTKIESHVNNWRAAVAISVGGTIPLAGLALLCLGLTDRAGVRTFWPVMLVIGLVCAGFLVSAATGICFALRGKYEIEYDEDTLRVRSIGLRESAWKQFRWKDISKIGFFQRSGLGTHGAMGVVSSGWPYTFGSELRYNVQLRLAEQLFNAWEQNRSQPGNQG